MRVSPTFGRAVCMPEGGLRSQVVTGIRAGRSQVQILSPD